MISLLRLSCTLLLWAPYFWILKNLEVNLGKEKVKDGGNKGGTRYGKNVKKKGKKIHDSRISNFPFQLKSKNKTFVIHPSLRVTLPISWYSQVMSTIQKLSFCIPTWISWISFSAGSSPVFGYLACVWSLLVLKNHHPFALFLLPFGQQLLVFSASVLLTSLSGF